MARPTKEELERRAEATALLEPEMGQGEAYFNARRAAIVALEQAQEAIAALQKLDGYSHSVSSHVALQEAAFHAAWALGFVRRASPESGMRFVATVLADLEEPYFATWEDAEPEALARLMPGADHNALAAADEKDRSPEAFKAERYAAARAHWALVEAAWRDNSKSD